MTMQRKRERGFSLIELVIVMAIIAILAAIAVPWWGAYTFRARRAEGQQLLMHVAQGAERFYVDYNHFPSSAASLGYASATLTSRNGYYEVTVTPPTGTSTGQGYIATAAPQGVQADDACGNLSIDNTGQKLPLPTSTARNSNGSCW